MRVETGQLCSAHHVRVKSSHIIMIWASHYHSLVEPGPEKTDPWSTVARCSSVCPSQIGIVSKRLNRSTGIQLCEVAEGLFCCQSPRWNSNVITLRLALLNVPKNQHFLQQMTILKTMVISLFSFTRFQSTDSAAKFQLLLLFFYPR